MRTILSILLLVVFGLPLVSPLLAFGPDGDAGVPVCCLKNGKHHCMMTGGERGKLVQHGPTISSPADRCPYRPGALVAGDAHVLAAPPADATFALLVSHPSGVAQTESKRRISRDRSRQKRGPPTVFTL